jgi:hypothetical protein
VDSDGWDAIDGDGDAILAGGWPEPGGADGEEEYGGGESGGFEGALGGAASIDGEHFGSSGVIELLSDGGPEGGGVVWCWVVGGGDAEEVERVLGGFEVLSACGTEE